MKRKTFLICMAAVILQMCFFTGCSKSNDTTESSQENSETSAMETSNAENDAVNGVVLPEVEIEGDTSETSQNESKQSYKTGDDSKAATTKATAVHNQTVTETKAPAKTNVPAATTKNNSKAETTKAVTTAVSSESETTDTTKGAIELPEIPFD